MHGTSLAVLLPLHLSWRLFVPLTALIICSAVSAVRRLQFRNSGSLHVLTWSSDGHWTASTRRGKELPLDLIGSYAHPWLLTLCFRHAGSRRRFCLAFVADSLPETDLHALRMRLMSR